MSYPVLQFERDADPDGEWITMAVRMKLDLCGRKIRLDDWSAFAPEDRASLHELSGEDAEAVGVFERRLLESASRAGLAEPAPLSPSKREGVVAWKDPGPEPPAVQAISGEAALDACWSARGRFERFVLSHLASRGDVSRWSSACRELDE